ncbi:uncharacterized protein BKCO1_37000164 [Diplodia corticola]|uniref:Uncharacterized protein n=1 Tax=Diplodia corticola TaxID=236234 RepID=A0A1J9RJB2_9PEZI|nr:uncharacterized protein BKCO1_37000164 [Diplodia corticola]OJD32651.1 hypothetical protein BKCO1_37000164 [Diplodia corticola]
MSSSKIQTQTTQPRSQARTKTKSTKTAKSAKRTGYARHKAAATKKRDPTPQRLPIPPPSPQPQKSGVRAIMRAANAHQFKPPLYPDECAVCFDELELDMWYTVCPPRLPGWLADRIDASPAILDLFSAVSLFFYKGSFG